MVERDPLVSQTIAGYRIERVLSRGPVSTVYRATQLAIQRPVALKILAPRFAEDRAFVSMFVAEARAAAKLSHPRIVQVHDVVQEGSRVLYSMEFVRGGSLARRVQKSGAISWETATSLLRDAAIALRFAETRGLLHACITPRHLLLGTDRRLKVLGIGLGHGLEARGPRRYPLASLPYLAPEQVYDRRIDHRSNIYSLGCTLCAALIGHSPLEGEPSEKILQAKRRGASGMMRAVSRTVPAAGLALIEKMTAVAPEDRYQSFEELLEAMNERMKDRPSVEAMAPSDLSARPAVGRSAVLLRNVTCVAAVLAVIAFVVYVFRPEASPPPEVGRAQLNDAAGLDVEFEETPRSPVDALLAEGRSAVGSRATEEDAVDRVLSAALAEIDWVETNWREELLLPRQALERLDRLRREHAGTAVDGLAANLAGRIQAKLDRAPTGAASLVAPPARTSAPPAEPDEATARAIEAIEAAEQEAETHVAAGDFAIAIKALEELESVPEPHADRLRERIEAIRGLEKRRDQLFAALAEAAVQVEGLLEAHDFKKAEEILAGLSSYDNDDYQWTKSVLTERVARCEGTWKTLRAALDSARGGAAFQVAFDPVSGHQRGPLTCRLTAMSGDRGANVRLTLAPLDGEPLTCDLFELDDATLLDLLRTANAPPGETASSVEGPPIALSRETVEGLGYLLGYRGAPVRARKFLVERPGLSKERSREHAEWIERTGESILRRRLDALDAVVSESPGAAPVGPAVEWQSARSDLEGLVLRHCTLPYYDRWRTRLTALYSRVERALLDERDIDQYVGGRARLQSDGTLELSYNFSRPEEIDDFVVVSGSRRLEDGRLRLRGECRVLFGDPFREWLSVSTVVARYDAARPNINIALWTRDDDRLLEDGVAVGRSASPPQEADAFDYLVFGVGYTGPVRGSLNLLTIMDSGLRVQTPCFAIIGGVHRQSLHRRTAAYRADCLWGEPVLNRVKGPQRIDLVVRPTSFSWIVSQHPLHVAAFKKQPAAMRHLARSGSTGSVTLFTNDRSVHYSMLEIRGEFNPAWLDALARRRAEQAVGLLEEGRRR